MNHMMALHKLKTTFQKNSKLNFTPTQKITSESGVIRIKDHSEIALPETSYASESEKSESVNIIKENAENIKVFVTGDRNLLNQYYKLRNDIFQNERGWTSHEWFESELDRKGKIVIAVNSDNKVIGGLRVMSSTCNEYLSDEFAGTEFTYPNLFEKMGLDKTLDYAEIDGVVVAKEHRNRYVMKEIVRVAADYAESEGCAYLIGIAPLHICRNDRAVFRSLGYEEVSIAVSFPWKQLEIYNNSKDFPVVGILTSKKT